MVRCAEIRTGSPRRLQRGSGALEIALGILMLAALMVALIDFSRWLYAWNAAGEATRLGARLASICERSDQAQRAIRQQMRAWLPDLTAESESSVIRIDYESPAGVPSASCDVDDCVQVSVWLDGYRIAALGGLVPGGVLPLPVMRASVTRESMNAQSGTCRSIS